MHERQHERERRLETDDAERRRLMLVRGGHRKVLLLRRVRRVVGCDHLERAVGERAANGRDVGFGAERRVHLGERTVRRDRLVVEHEVMRRRLGRDARAGGPGRAYRRDGLGRLRCATWRCAPVSAASAQSRATITLSAADGMPGRPRRALTTPACIRRRRRAFDPRRAQ
jgi:hypothetical protein